MCVTSIRYCNFKTKNIWAKTFFRAFKTFALLSANYVYILFMILCTVLKKNMDDKLFIFTNTRNVVTKSWPNSHRVMSSRILLVLALISTTNRPAVATCPGMCYKGGFSSSKHVTADYALHGYSYANLTAQSSQHCFSSCVIDCRCVSFQLFGTRCELLDNDKLGAADHFPPRTPHIAIMTCISSLSQR